jgi:hypothetical protein
VAEVPRAGPQRPDWGQAESKADGSAVQLAQSPVSAKLVMEDLPVTDRSQPEASTRIMTGTAVSAYA